MRMTRLVAAAAVGAMLVAACGGDDGTADPSEGATTDGMTTSEEMTTGDTEAAGETVVVTAVDYAFEDVPTSVSAGTTIELRNDSQDEVHEMLFVLLPDGDDRPVSEILAGDEAEIGALMGAGMRGVAFVPPDGVEGPPLTSVTLEQPGRYMLFCGLPQNGPPDEIVAAAVAFVESGEEEGGPEYPETGPPHFTLGMVSELEVTAG